MSEELVQKLKEVFSKHGVSISENDRDMSIDDFFGMDSITYVQILNQMASDFGIKINDADLLSGDLTTFNNILEFINQKQMTNEVR
ncbi:acyl carrier protein [Paenibacillus solani]|uniref:acyl carrier protein n=1 Tax=Paenibacillus solani TaxID=1705565 RepID=UPI003D2CB64C